MSIPSDKLQDLNGSNLNIAIVASRFNEEVMEGLIFGSRKALNACKVKDTNVALIRVAGSWEIPFAVSYVIEKIRPDAVVALGAIVKGETKHDEYLAQAVTNALMEISLKTKIPVGLGVLTVLNLEQAKARSSDNNHNHGFRAAYAAVELALLAKAS